MLDRYCLMEISHKEMSIVATGGQFCKTLTFVYTLFPVKNKNKSISVHHWFISVHI